MKKKNHTLRGFVVTGGITILLTWLLLVLGTVLSGALNEGGNNVVPLAVSWFTSFESYLEALKVVLLKDLWVGTYMKPTIIWYVGVGSTVFTFVLSFILAATKRKGKYVGVSFLNLVYCLTLLYAILGVYYTNYANPTEIAAGLLFVDIKNFVLFRTGEYGWYWSIYLITILVLILITIISVIGIFFTSMSRVFKREKAVEKVEVKEEVKVETVETPIVEEKKKPILLVKKYDKYGKTGPVIESTHCDYPNQPITPKALTPEEIRTIIRDELERQEALRIAEQYKQEQNAKLIAESIAKATNLNRPAETPAAKIEETCACEELNDEEKKVYPSPIIFAMPTSTREEFKAREVKKTEPAKKEVKPKLNEEEIKKIIADEISKALKDFVITKETIVEKPVEIKIPATTTEVVEEKVEETPVVEEKVIEETPIVEETVVEEAPVVLEEKEEVKVETVEEKAVTEETVVEEAPVVEETVVEEAPAALEETEEVIEETPVTEEAPVLETEEAPKNKIIRIPFTTRMLAADDSLKAAYNELKSLLKSYGLNNRVANGGDSFRLHRVTYCKITVAGKSLKLYLALNPADYADTTYPVKDASSKAIYKETPLVFKVKSGLSLRRGEELIRDCMDKHGLEQIDQVQVKDWASDLANVNVDEDDDDAYIDEE